MESGDVPTPPSLLGLTARRTASRPLDGLGRRRRILWRKENQVDWSREGRPGCRDRNDVDLAHEHRLRWAGQQIATARIHARQTMVMFRLGRRLHGLHRMARCPSRSPICLVRGRLGTLEVDDVPVLEACDVANQRQVAKRQDLHRQKDLADQPKTSRSRTYGLACRRHRACLRGRRVNCQGKLPSAWHALRPPARTTAHPATTYPRETRRARPRSSRAASGAPSRRDPDLGARRAGANA